jgi:thymidylate kinase
VPPGVILLINGAFGVGKTTAARWLTRRLPGSALYDPEHVGFLLRLLGSRQPDFQQDPRWARHVVRGARILSVFRRTLVVPMTLWRADVHDEIVGRLRRFATVVCVRLTASARVLNDRIERDAGPAREWRRAHVERCLLAFADPRFGVEIATDGLDADAVALRIEAECLR